ncbi:gp9 [Klebsiella pneumoniae]|uniref:Gp9 n=1 Tax=Klebsiella pneumoniae TaxID=573 RepID=A0A378BYU8_KLEPN|nr:gp9 [Klebsiella pneumoniae]
MYFSKETLATNSRLGGHWKRAVGKPQYVEPAERFHHCGKPRNHDS